MLGSVRTVRIAFDRKHLLWFAMHLNDNLGISDFGGKIFGTGDLHFLPFDGIADRNNIAVRLHRDGFEGPLTFEPDLFSNRKKAQAPTQKTAFRSGKYRECVRCFL